MNTADALYQARQCEALASAAERALDRLLAAVDGTDCPGHLVDVVRIRLDDARLLERNLHWIVRQLEAIGAGAPQ